MTPDADRWPFAGGGEAEADPSREDRAVLARACARLFAHDDGRRLLAHLHALTLGRHLGPESSDAALRHLEGQRALVAHLTRLIAEGGGTPGP
ncbi:hypothetical protein [Roseospira navarrensis]|uniref:Bbp19-like phage domain-containing protein n=1 Tax=Roseospira navarrensis TaxID=140058 RepID=A0A7X1ZBG8_9PROT|nr:hypothetical protein [Roseospira navarrensis]MQX35480.1 hypothetical protein [Roseospira navarrensis]